MLIIADREVRPVMGPAAFLPGEGAGDDGLRDIEQGLELEDLHEIRIKHPPFILYHNGPGSMGQCGECRERSRHGFVSRTRPRLRLINWPSSSRICQARTDPSCAQQALDATLFGGELVCCECLWRDGSSVLSCSDSSAPTKHNRLKK